jgi:hypothetical protein
LDEWVYVAANISGPADFHVQLKRSECGSGLNLTVDFFNLGDLLAVFRSMSMVAAHSCSLRPPDQFDMIVISRLTILRLPTFAMGGWGLRAVAPPFAPGLRIDGAAAGASDAERRINSILLKGQPDLHPRSSPRLAQGVRARSRRIFRQQRARTGVGTHFVGLALRVGCRYDASA